MASHENIADLTIAADNPLENPLLLQPPTNLIYLLAWVDIRAPCEFVIVKPRRLTQGLNNSIGVCRHGCAREIRRASVPRKLGSYSSSTWFWFHKPERSIRMRGQ